MSYKGDKVNNKDIHPPDIDIGKFTIIQATFPKNLSQKEQNIKFCAGVNREFVALLLSITKREGLSKI